MEQSMTCGIYCNYIPLIVDIVMSFLLVKNRNVFSL